MQIDSTVFSLGDALKPDLATLLVFGTQKIDKVDVRRKPPQERASVKRKGPAKDGVNKVADAAARPFSHVSAEAMGGPYSIDGLDFQDKWARLHCLRRLDPDWRESDTGAEFYGIRVEGVDDVTLYWKGGRSKRTIATEYVQMKLRIDSATLNGVLRHFSARQKHASQARLRFRVVAGSCSENLRTLREVVARVQHAQEPGGELSREYIDSRADLAGRLRSLKLKVDPDFLVNAVLLDLNKSSLLDDDEYNALLRSELINYGIPRDKIGESALRLSELITCRRHGTFIQASEIRASLDPFREKATTGRPRQIMAATLMEAHAPPSLPLSAHPRVEITLFPGGASLMEFEDGSLGLIDCDRAATEQVISHMQRRNARRFAFVAVTHWHLDHYSGLPGILDYAEQVDIVCLPQFNNRQWPLIHSASMVIKWVQKELADGKTRLLMANGWHEIGSRTAQDKRVSVRIAVSTPSNPPPYRTILDPRKAEDQNAQSTIFRVSIGETAFLVAGDATLDRWRDALSQAQQAGGSLVSDGVLLPHNGSALSMSSDILSRITKPTGFVAPVEPSRRFGLPRDEVLQSVERLGGRVIIFSTAPVHLRIEAEGLFHRVG